MKNHIVIIGGMGPQASLSLHKRILDAAANSGAKHCHQYPQITHISLPIRDFISNSKNKDEALGLIIKSLSGFIFGSNTRLVLACNTAHLLVPKLEVAMKRPVVSLIDTVVNDVSIRRLKRVGLLASPTTIQGELFSAPLERMGAEVILPSKDSQKTVERLIRQTIANVPRSTALPVLRRQTQQMLSVGCEAVILGCTELSVINASKTNSKTIDPLTLIAQQLVIKGTNNV